MKRILWLAVIFFTSQCSPADSIPLFNITNVDVGFGINFGGGENGGFRFQGPGTIIGGDAGTSCDYCFSGNSFLPGQSVDASIDFIGFSNYQTVLVRGQTLDPNFFGLTAPKIIAGTFTFPLGAEPTFTVTLPANFNGILQGNASEIGEFKLKVPPGKLTLTFNSFPGSNGYFFTDARFIATVPEPGTLVMVASGLLAVGTRLYRRGRRVDR